MPQVQVPSVDQALLAHEAGDYGQAFCWLKSLAEQGAAEAYHMLGYLYDVGRGTRRSKAKAIYWYRKAYANGESASASNLATIYRDSGAARLEFEWYKRAADLGDGDALLEIGIRYLSGKGIRRSAAKAVACFAAAMESKNACEASRDTARQLLWGTQR